MSTLKTTNITHGSNSGTANMVLAADGGVTIPEKKLYCPGGIVQVKSVTKTDQQNITSCNNSGSSTTPQQYMKHVTSLVLAITPTASSSKILIMYDVAATAEERYGGIAIFRGSSSTSTLTSDTPVGIGAATSNRTRITKGIPSNEETTNDEYENAFSVTGTFLDSPATTSEIFYKIGAGYNNTNDITVHINRSASNADAVYSSVPISTLTLMEIAA